jgi:hypothetical protein
MLIQKYREATINTLDRFLDGVKDLKRPADCQLIDLLIPYIRDSLEATKQGWNSDLVEVYAPLFREELPEYNF